MGLCVDFVLMSYEGEFLEEAESHFKVLDLACDRTWKLPAKLIAYLMRNKPDVLISSFWKLNLCACISKLFCGDLDLLLWEHSPPSKSKNSPTWLYAISASLFYQIGTQVIVVSNGVREDIDGITFGLGRKLKVIFNAVLPPETNRQLPQRDPSKRKLLWVGRLDIPKNPQLLLEAFALLPFGYDFTLDFIGDGPLRAELEVRRDALGLREVVCFHGFQSRPYDWMDKSNLLILTSDREGLPTVLVEGLYSGIKIVSTNCGGGIKDILLDGKYGAIVPVGDINALVNVILSVMNSKSNYKNQIEGAMRFQPRNIAEQFLEVLHAKVNGEKNF
jgi:glycosyltransferase involved in cell wall biosynthesis